MLAWSRMAASRLHGAHAPSRDVRTQRAGVSPRVATRLGDARQHGCGSDAPGARAWQLASLTNPDGRGPA